MEIDTDPKSFYGTKHLIECPSLPRLFLYPVLRILTSLRSIHRRAREGPSLHSAIERYLYRREETVLPKCKHQSWRHSPLPLWWCFVWVLYVYLKFHSSRYRFTTYVDHFGVVKAFLDANLLPRVMSGTSAGGLIASFVCCYTEDELKTLLVPELANRITACEEPFSVWFKRFWTTGTVYPSIWEYCTQGCI